MLGMLKYNWKRLVSLFLTGVFAILPLVITLGVISWVIGVLQDWVGPGTFFGDLLAGFGGQWVQNKTAAMALGWGLVLLVILLAGMIFQSRLKVFVKSMVETIMRRIPVVSFIYSTAAQVVGMVQKDDDQDLSGMKVVFCSFGAAHGSGLLALMPTPEIYHFNDREYQAIYIPTSPIPMTGGILLVPAESIQVLDMTVEGLMSIYLSMGVTAPEFLNKPKAA